MPISSPPPEVDDGELLTPQEAAARLRISRTRVFELVARGELESVKIGRLRRILPSSLPAYVARRRDG